MKIEELKKKLNPNSIKTRRQAGFELSYIEGWHAIAEANRIFGFDAWRRETLYMVENHEPYENNNGKHVVSFRASVRVTVGDIYRDGVGFGSGIANSIQDAYEGAIKEAETDAMKRALMTFGNPFGLALYDKDKKNVGVEPTDEEIKALKEKWSKWVGNKQEELEMVDDHEALDRWFLANKNYLKSFEKFDKKEHDELMKKYVNINTVLMERDSAQ